MRRPQSGVVWWLDGFKSEETRRGYRGDHAAWLTYCAGHGIDPLAARRVDIDRWARALEAAGAKRRSASWRIASRRASGPITSSSVPGRMDGAGRGQELAHLARAGGY
jgi:hypothetical protein